MDLSQFIPTNLTVWQIIFAILSVIGGWIASRYARRGMLALGKKAPGISQQLVDLAARLAQYTLILIGVGVALGFLGASIQPLIAVALIASVILVLVLRGVADNFAAGVLIQSRQPVKIGEEITVEGPDGTITGTVHDLNGRSVIITTTDGRTVHVPNGLLLSEVLVNNSRHGARRSALQVRVAKTETSTDEVDTLIEETLNGVDGVHSRESVRIVVVEVSPERRILRVEFWHHPLHGVQVASDAVTAVAGALADAGHVATVTSAPPPVPLAAPDTV